MQENTHKDVSAHSWAASLIPPAEGVVVFEQMGSLDHDAVLGLIAATEAASLANNDDKLVRKRLINVVLEGLENLDRHVEPSDRATAFARLTVTTERYRLLLGNVSTLTAAALLMSRIGVLNEMSTEDLKGQYLQLLAQEGRTARGGAGLGLLTIARRCEQPMVVNLEPAPEGQAYVLLVLTISRSA